MNFKRAQFSVDFRCVLPFFPLLHSVYNTNRFSLKDYYQAHEHIAISYGFTTPFFFLFYEFDDCVLNERMLMHKCYGGVTTSHHSLCETSVTNYGAGFILHIPLHELIGCTVVH